MLSQLPSTTESNVNCYTQSFYFKHSDISFVCSFKENGKQHCFAVMRIYYTKELQYELPNQRIELSLLNIQNISVQEHNTHSNVEMK